MSESGPYLSVVIPAKCEERRIGPTIETIAAHLARQGYPSEVLLVNDGSTDATVAAALEAAERASLGLRVLDRLENRGKGFSVREGMLAATGAYRLFTDADLSTPIEELARLLAPLERGEAEVAIGSRALPESVLEVHQPWFREAGGRFFNLVVRACGLPEYADTQCGFKLFSAVAAEAVFPLQRLERWGFDVEILWIARAHGLRVAEIPVHWINSPDSRVSTLAGLSTFADIARVRWNHLRGRYRRTPR